MNQYERATLDAIAKGPEYVGWYKIEQRLSSMDLSSREYLPETLQRLAHRGLIEAHPHNKDTYKVAESGKAALADRSMK